jgi:hypothetical protein
VDPQRRATRYIPFPGKPGGGVQEDISLGVSVIDFTIANSGSELQGNLLSSDFALAFVQVGRVFTGTPDLGRLEMYDGKIGDFQYDRLELTGQAKPLEEFKRQLAVLHLPGQMRVALRFAGCGFNLNSVTIALEHQVGSSTTIDFCSRWHALGSFASGRFDFGRCHDYWRREMTARSRYPRAHGRSYLAELRAVEPRSLRADALHPSGMQEAFAGGLQEPLQQRQELPGLPVDTASRRMRGDLAGDSLRGSARVGRHAIRSEGPRQRRRRGLRRLPLRGL